MLFRTDVEDKGKENTRYIADCLVGIGVPITMQGGGVGLIRYSRLHDFTTKR